jgi:hypothetical protein
MGITVDKEAMDDQLVQMLAREPDLFSQVENLFWGDGAPYEAGAVFDHFFCVVESDTFNTECPILALRIRKPDEIRAALHALEGQIGKARVHGNHHTPSRTFVN